MALEYCRTLNFHGALYEVACECRDARGGSERFRWSAELAQRAQFYQQTRPS